MNRLRAVLNWLAVSWPFALKATVQAHRDAAAVAQRHVEVATDLYIAERRRRESLSSLLDTFAALDAMRPRVAVEDPTPDEGMATDA